MGEIFGIAKDKLRPIIAEAVREEVDSFKLSARDHVTAGVLRDGCYGRYGRYGCYGCYGIMGEKGVWNFSYVTKSGQRGEKRIFVKKYYDSLPKEEGYHYRCLEDYDAPIPRLYGTLRDKKGREILFLEYLNVVAEDETSFLKDASKSRMFVQAIARFNGIQPCGDYASYLEKELKARSGPDDWEERMEAVALSLDDIWKRGLAGELGSSVKGLCADHYSKKTKLQARARGLIQLVEGMKKGLCHRDFAHHCTGWRDDVELVIFDLEDVGLDARFTDVALLLGAPDASLSERQELIEHYLSEYSQGRASNVSLDQFLSETRILWQALTLWHAYLCWWNNGLLDKGAELARLPDAKDNIEETRIVYREGIYKRLKTFMERVEL
jgi:hypothetical protein